MKTLWAPFSNTLSQYVSQEAQNQSIFAGFFAAAIIEGFQAYGFADRLGMPVAVWLPKDAKAGKKVGKPLPSWPHLRYQLIGTVKMVRLQCCLCRCLFRTFDLYVSACAHHQTWIPQVGAC